MKINLIHFNVYLLLVLVLFGCQTSKVKQNETNKIIVWLQLSAKMAHPEPENYILKDNMALAYLPVKNTGIDTPWSQVNAMVSNGYVKWIFYSDEPVKINYGFGNLPIVSPGDSVIIMYNGEEYKFRGKGAHKLVCWNEMRIIGNKMSLPTLSNNLVNNIEEYNRWNRYVDDKLNLQLPLLDSSISKLSSFEYKYLKTMTISMAESDRIQAFESLRAKLIKNPEPSLKLSDLTLIWDSTQYRPLAVWLQTLPDYYNDIYFIEEYNKVEVWRQFNFDFNKDSLKTKQFRNYLYYTHAKQKYKGLLRERVLRNILTQQAKLGFNEPISQNMLKDYYNQPGYPEYKKQVKDLEKKIAQKLAKK